MTSPGASFGASAHTALPALSVCLDPVAQRQGHFPRSHEGETRHAPRSCDHGPLLHGYRLRVGNYRVFFDFDGAVRIVSIEEVKKRDERTY